ncbi:hypothetical protein M406DRAFT_330384 [Cryphonectria parasitica EP155]|uniref:Uncharacterized protein n=1 Tax=Cryphonectria parasitica (strain ATCC 38755 / EP155) TaxID=660469 RepID=A0A9P5CPK4_CRYP1|nr:uncharacterized protein M406DRAFT_330384 [Cryphonectria parasitica EP155]KAF3766579.1 hypothetical protein M406DRAFT_330384 [Cryphonectria parasitica EP155]
MRSLLNTTLLGLFAFVLAMAGAIDIRSEVVHGMQYCGNFANADGSMSTQLVDKLGEGDLKDRQYTVAAHGCNRVQCWDTSGVYVCNDNDSELTVSGEQVSDVGELILSGCCMFSASGKDIGQEIMSGQQFTQWGWNVIVAYADCNVPITEKPSNLGGYGVNGGTCWEYSSMAG